MEYQIRETELGRNETDPILKIFYNRGFKNPNEVHHYLYPSDQDISSPLLLDNMEQGVKILTKHIMNNGKIFIQVDSDADGFTSAALLINYLFRLFPNFTKNNITYRLHEGKQHGVILDTVPEDTTLVIIPDAGSNQFDEHKILKDKGIDVLVLDHHEVDVLSTDACIINNQTCGYPSKSLSGVGIVYKFCSYIDELLKIFYANNYIDLVALGGISDMMDLRDFELKRLIDIGLNNITNPFFKEMVSLQNYSISRHGILDPYAVSFYITPQINATIRVGTQEEKEILFKAMLEHEAYNLVPSTKRGCKGQEEFLVIQACRNCNNIKNRQQKLRDESLNSIISLIEEKELNKNKILAIKLETPVNKNLTGLIANQLMAKFQQPVLLLNKTIDEDGKLIWSGSGRNYANSKIEDLRNYLNETGYSIYAQGHASAFGYAISDDNFNDFVNYTNEDLKDFEFAPVYKVDFIFNGADFQSNIILKIAELKSIWGQGIEEPYVAIRRLAVHKNNVSLLSKDKNPTLKITLPNGTNIMKFKSSEEEYEVLTSAEVTYIDLVGKCSANEWNGMTTPQILIEDYEVVEKMDYYF